MEEKTRNSWRTLCRSLGARRAVEESLLVLDEGYGSQTRHYHSWKHVESCLEELAGCGDLDDEATVPLRPRAGEPGLRGGILRAALWFHDAVYDPRREDNEERSADLLLELGDRMGLHRSSMEAAARLVLATRHLSTFGQVTGAPSYARSCEQHGIGQKEEELVCDIDLAVLGRSWRSFEEYEGGIRLEYAFVPEGEYRRKRSLVLRSFLERPAIYRGSRFAGLYEARARENIARLVASLR
ncbi:MAG: hypothetical protein WCL50_13495 [Spirochaetota bacterium]